jgi:hypothetical protein
VKVCWFPRDFMPTTRTSKGICVRCIMQVGYQQKQNLINNPCANGSTPCNLAKGSWLNHHASRLPPIHTHSTHPTAWGFHIWIAKMSFQYTLSITVGSPNLSVQLEGDLVVSKTFRQLNWRFCGFVLAFLSTHVSIVQCFSSSCYEYFCVPVSQALTSEVWCLSAQAFFLWCEYFCVPVSRTLTSEVGCEKLSLGQFASFHKHLS